MERYGPAHPLCRMACRCGACANIVDAIEAIEAVRGEAAVAPGKEAA